MAHSDEFLRFSKQHRAAVKAGLISAANVYRNAVMRHVAGGYTSGRFVHGNAMNSIHLGPVHVVAGQQFLRVGTDVPYMAFWEFGFRQRLWVWYSDKLQRWVSVPPPRGPTRFVRVPYWEQSMNESASNMAAAFGRVYKTWIER